MAIYQSAVIILVFRTKNNITTTNCLAPTTESINDRRSARAMKSINPVTTKIQSAVKISSLFVEDGDY